MITCPSCGSELRPPASAECPVCLTALPDDVRQAVAAKADAETRALAAEQAAAAAAAAQAAAQQAAAQQAAAYQAAQAQAAQATNTPGFPPPPPPPPLYPPPMSGAYTGGPAPASGYPTGAPAPGYPTGAPTFAPSPWAPGAPASPSIPLRPGAPPTVPLSTYGAPQYAAQPGTIPNYPHPAQPVGYRVGVVPQQNSGLATASLILGIFAILGLCTVYWAFVPGLPAVICGHQALNRINGSGGTIGGRGLAIAGLVMGYIALGISVIAFCAYASTPH